MLIDTLKLFPQQIELYDKRGKYLIFLIKKLGEGSFGIVGEYQNKINLNLLYAVKMSKLQNNY